MTPLLTNRLRALPEGSRILDAGGWFNPCMAATHVVDLMPYETRRGHLDPAPLAGELFTKATWCQAEFTRDDLRLPFPDGFFHFSICTQTVEDLTDPIPLLRELQRVSRAGYVECPSRLSEQTTGVRDRITNRHGHPHHNWIVDAAAGLMELAPKASLDGLAENSFTIPLRFYERETQGDPGKAVCQLFWEREFAFRALSREDAQARAVALCMSLRISTAERWQDSATRHLRGVKWRWLRRQQEDPSAWWQEMLRLSRPYSTIPL